MGRVIRPQQVSGKLPELGKIKVGEKKLNKDGKEIPTSLDYFRVTGDYAKLFENIYGDKCTSIPIVFASDDTDTVCNEEYVVRDRAGRILAKGDGQNWDIWDTKAEKYTRRTATVDEVSKLGKVKLTLTLRFLIVSVKVLGHWKFETSGELSTIPQVRDTFDYVRQQAGTICKIPFDLKVKKVKSQKPGAASSFPVVSLVPNLSAESVERLSEFVSAGSVPKGLLTEEKLMAPMELPPVAPEPKEEEVFTSFEEVVEEQEDDLQIAVREMLAFDDFKDASAHWRSHKQFWENKEYYEAKEQVKTKIKLKENGITEQSNPVG